MISQVLKICMKFGIPMSKNYVIELKYYYLIVYKNESLNSKRKNLVE